MKANIKHGFEMMKSPAAMDKWEILVTNLHVGGLGYWSFRLHVLQGDPAAPQMTKQP